MLNSSSEMRKEREIKRLTAGGRKEVAKRRRELMLFYAENGTEICR